MFNKIILKLFSFLLLFHGMEGPGGSTSQVVGLPNNSYLSPIRRRFAPGFVNYKKGCTRLATASDKVYQLLAHGRWFSPGTPASSTTKTGRHDIAEILLKVALNTKNQIIHGMCTIVSSKGNNSNKKNSKAYNFRIKTETGKLSIIFKYYIETFILPQLASIS